ncbi:MAG: TonB-dependent receptor [Chitinophagales bacterium]|nr:TonB-dependent receptor [Chitinophagales bacterium]
MIQRLAFIYFLIFSHICIAQYKITEDSHNLGVVKISENRLKALYGPRVPHNVTSITSDQFKKLPTLHQNEALNYVCGVTAFQRNAYGTSADLSIQGSTFEQVAVTLNGSKITDVQTAHNVHNLPFPIFAVRGITIQQGAQSSRIGNNGLAGVIDYRIEPKDNNEVEIGGYASSNFNHDSASGKLYYQVGLWGNIHVGDKKNRYQVSFQVDTSTGHSFNTRSQMTKLMLASKHQLDEQTALRFLAMMNLSSMGAPYFFAFPFDRNAQERINTFFFQAEVNKKFSEKWTSNSKVNLRSGFDEYTLIASRPSVYQNRHYSTTLAIEQHLGYEYALGQLGIGADFRTEEIKSNNLGDRKRWNQGIFIENQWNLKKKTIFKPSLYLNINSDFGTDLFYGLSVSHTLNNSLILTSNVARGMRAPSFTDLYYSDRSNLGNPYLIAERGHTFDIGLRYIKPKFMIQGLGFWRNVDNFITWFDTDTSSRRLWQASNASVVNTYGFQFKFTTQKLKFLEFGEAQFQSSYQFLQLDNPLTDSKYPIFTSRHQMVNQIMVSGFNELIGVQLTHRYLQQLSGQDFHLVDTRVFLNINKTRIYMDINNMLNQEYFYLEHIIMPGRFLRIGFDLTLK